MNIEQTMRYWDTGDRVVDCLLQKMEGLSSWRDGEDPDPERTHQLLVAVINLQKMLPRAVARHFKFPRLIIGNDHFRLDGSYRRKLVGEITAALATGIAKAAEDPLLKRGGGGDFSDRPKSRGEVILDAIARVNDDRSPAALAALKAAVAPTRLQSRVRTIEKLTTRVRPIGNQSPEAAIYAELYRLESEAEAYHSEMADSY